jgi:hypothetical protein
MSHTCLKSDVTPLFLSAKFGCPSLKSRCLRPEFPLLRTLRNSGSKLLKDRLFAFHITHDSSTKLTIPLHFVRARLSRIASGYRERRRGLGSLRTVRGLPRRDAMRSWVRVAPGGGPPCPSRSASCTRSLSARSRASIAAQRKNYDAQAEGAELEFPRGSTSLVRRQT